MIENMKGKNTGNNLNELLEILAEIEKSNFDFDGCIPDNIIQDIKEDISELLESEEIPEDYYLKY